MRPASLALFVLLAIPAAAHAQTAGAQRPLPVINRAHDSIVAIAVAEPGGGRFREIPLDGPLHGGGNEVTVQMPVDGCRHDVRLVFRGGRSVVYKDLQTCRLASLRVDRVPRGESPPRWARQP